MEHLAKGLGSFKCLCIYPQKSTYVCLLNDPQLHHLLKLKTKVLNKAVMYSGAASQVLKLPAQIELNSWQNY